MKFKYIIVLISILLYISCQQSTKKTVSDKDKSVHSPLKEDFDTIIDGENVTLFTLKNVNGIEIKLTNYGARVVSILAPDKKGNFADIAMGYNTIEEYLVDKMYQGCVVGRYANRIKEGKFSIGDQEYKLFLNDGPNALHGGKKGFDKVVWDAVQNGNSVSMKYISPDMEEGYPGELTVALKYTLTDNDELKLEYEATTDKTTVVNLSNHTYFNLKGEGDSTILDHKFIINADYITPVNATLIPTGELMPVENTAFDFRKGMTIGEKINEDHEQLKNGLGYDHNWVLNKKNEELTMAIIFSEPLSGRAVEIKTTEPGLQFYSGNFMDGTIKGKSGRAYQYRSGFVLETQHFPDSPNQPEFPETTIEPGETYKQTTIYRFYTTN